jgi:hypothetical protein
MNNEDKLWMLSFQLRVEEAALTKINLYHYRDKLNCMLESKIEELRRQIAEINKEDKPCDNFVSKTKIVRTTTVGGVDRTMTMKLSKHETIQLSQALIYAVMYAKTEEETAEFAVLKIKIEGEITKLKQNEGLKCKACGRQLEHYAIASTGLCTACFTSNA